MANIKIRPTSRYYPFDLDGNRLACFPGYAVQDEFGSLEGLFRALPEAMGITIEDRRGETQIVRRGALA